LDWSAVCPRLCLQLACSRDIVSAAEYDGLLPQDTELAQKTNVPDVFGATTEDTNGLRIVSLHEVSRISNMAGNLGTSHAGMLHESFDCTHLHTAICRKVQCHSIRVINKQTHKGYSDHHCMRFV